MQALRRMHAAFAEWSRQRRAQPSHSDIIHLAKEGVYQNPQTGITVGDLYEQLRLRNPELWYARLSNAVDWLENRRMIHRHSQPNEEEQPDDWNDLLFPNYQNPRSYRAPRLNFGGQIVGAT